MKRIPLFLLLSVAMLGFSSKHQPKADDFGTIKFTNPWNVAINAEVRVGNNGDPLQNSVAFNGSIPSKGFISISNGTSCFQYRRTANPGNNNGQMTNWTNSCASFDQNIDLN